MASQDALFVKMAEEFTRPVESIMRCEDFKSNFARRLSNRYTSKSPVSTQKQDMSLKLRVTDKSEEVHNVPERIEASSQLSKNVVDLNAGALKSRDIKSHTHAADMKCTEKTVLNMEVDTLRWQLAQTEANRQMHIALLKQIVTFLNRVRDHIDNQKNESPRKESMSTRISPRSFNIADLPRSRSVLHVDKNLEFSSPTKKISTKKISKSISNVNGYKDCAGIWNQPKFSLVSESENTQKISEEMSRLITLANTVLSTKLPDLACTCINTLDHDVKPTNYCTKTINTDIAINDSTTSLGLIEEDTSNAFILNSVTDNDDIYESISNDSIEVKTGVISDFIVTQTPLTCGLENDFAGFELNEKERQSSLSVKNVTESANGKTLKSPNDKRSEYSHVSNFIEDESGFSSMSSFQEIGIPIISIIPPSPCKEMGYIDEIPDILNGPDNWKNDSLDINKQTVKVFWV